MSRKLVDILSDLEKKIDDLQKQGATTKKQEPLKPADLKLEIEKIVTAKITAEFITNLYREQ